MSLSVGSLIGLRWCLLECLVVPQAYRSCTAVQHRRVLEADLPPLRSGGQLSGNGGTCRKMTIFQIVRKKNRMPGSRPDGICGDGDPGRRRVHMTVAPAPERRTTGRGHTPSAVRKAEARPPAPGPVSQVAANLGAGSWRPRGPEATGRLRPTRDARAQGPVRADAGAGRPMPSLKDSPADMGRTY